MRLKRKNGKLLRSPDGRVKRCGCCAPEPTCLAETCGNSGPCAIIGLPQDLRVTISGSGSATSAGHRGGAPCSGTWAVNVSPAPQGPGSMTGASWPCGEAEPHVLANVRMNSAPTTFPGYAAALSYMLSDAASSTVPLESEALASQGSSASMQFGPFLLFGAYTEACVFGAVDVYYNMETGAVYVLLFGNADPAFWEVTSANVSGSVATSNNNGECPRTYVVTLSGSYTARRLLDPTEVQSASISGSLTFEFNNFGCQPPTDEGGGDEGLGWGELG